MKFAGTYDHITMELKPHIEIKLNNKGRYTWSILVFIDETKPFDSIELAKSIDSKLKDKFPDFTQKSSGYIKDIDED